MRKVTSSKAFAQAPRLNRFLTFVVEEAIAGRGDALKEQVIGFEVFEKDTSYDPRIDPVVRTEARRLRYKLTEYYDSDGRDDSIRIDLPKGTYCPSFRTLPVTSHADPEVPTSTQSWRLWSGFALAVVILLGGVYWSRWARPAQNASLAVLPLENLSNDPEQEYFSDGMTDALITDLAKVRNLRVISRTSVLRFKRAKVPLAEIARQLGVDYLVEGTVIHSGNRVRITAQLIAANHERHLWAETYDRDMSDTLALQSEVAQAIVEQIDVRLSPQDRQQLIARRTVAPEAQDAYMKGRYLWGQRELAGLRKSIDYFNEAIRRQPDYALAYSALADSWLVLLGDWYIRTEEAIPNARRATMRALELDPTLGAPHAALGSIAETNWDWKTADLEFRQCIRAEPGYATGHQWYAELLSKWGRAGDAIREATRSVELDPLSPITNSILGLVYYRARRYDDAVHQMLQTRALFPHSPANDIPLGMTYLAQGNFAEAVNVFEEQAAQTQRIPQVVSLLCYAEARLGHREAALKLLAELQNNPHTTPLLMTGAYLGLGELSKAMDWLEKGYEQHDAIIEEIETPIFDSGRSEPRFQAVLRKMNWPD